MSVRQADWFPKPWFLQQFLWCLGLECFAHKCRVVLRFVGMLHF
jgi:hypothetical protein